MKKIGTHNGTFHCDEVLACYMLKQLEEYKDADIVRSRDPAVLNTCDIVVDVGGVFEPEKHRYDHHQRGFAESMSSLNAEYTWTTKLSSAGLVYFHFGQRVIESVLEKLDLKCPPEMTEKLYAKVYEMFVEEVDAIDNGISVAEGNPRYVQTTSLSSRVGYLNAWWNQEGVDEFAQFQKAMKLVGSEFSDRILFFAKCWWPARALVEDAVNKRKEIDESGEIVCLSTSGCPWRDHLFTLEQEQGIEPGIKFVLYTDNSGNWRVQCVPVRRGSFENRLSLLEEWRGIRDDELTKKSGIAGCIFVHASGFIGGNKTYDGALEMARRTLKKRHLDNGDA